MAHFYLVIYIEGRFYGFICLFVSFTIWKIVNIYKVDQDSLYFKGGFKGNYLREKTFTRSYVILEI